LALDHSFEEYLMVCVEPDLYERTDVTYATYGKLLVLTLKVVGDVKVPWEVCYTVVVTRSSVAPERYGLKVHIICGP
jgi:hypothetical protein